MQGPLRWQTVRDEALRRIRNHEWPAGERIPDEVDLAEELGCARATVNRALRDLADSGLLERRRRGGTTVTLNPVRKAVFSIPIIRKDIEARGQTAGYRLLSDTLAPVPAEIAAVLGADTPFEMRHIMAIYTTDDAPFCLEDRWLNPEIAGAEVTFDALSANEWLVQTQSFSSGTLCFLALNAEPAQAALLGCAPGAALLGLDRTTRNEHPITAVRLIYAPGHRVETAL